MANRAINEHRDVGRTATDVHQCHADVLLVLGQSRGAGGQRLQTQVGHFQATATDAFNDVLRRRHRAGDDVYFHFQAHAGHADRRANTVLVIDFVLLWQDVQNLLIRRNADRTRGVEHALNVVLRDFGVFHRDHAAGVEAVNMAACNTRTHAAHGEAGTQFRLLDRVLNGLNRFLDIHHHAALHTARRMVADADDIESIVRQNFGNHGHHFGCTNVQRHN